MTTVPIMITLMTILPILAIILTHLTIILSHLTIILTILMTILSHWNPSDRHQTDRQANPQPLILYSEGLFRNSVIFMVRPRTILNSVSGVLSTQMSCHIFQASDWLRRQFLAVVLVSQSKVACIWTLSAFYHMAKQHSSEVSDTVHCTEVACIFALLAFQHMAQGSHKKNYETLDIFHSSDDTPEPYKRDCYDVIIIGYR